MSDNKTRFQQALREAAEQEFEQMPHGEAEIGHEFSPEFQNRMDQLFFPKKKQIYVVLQRAACVFLLLAVVSSLAMSVEAFRTPILNMMNLHEHLYISSHGYRGDVLKDENGRSYIEYTGGELCIPYRIKTNRVPESQTVGLLVFVDGQPQPYKTSENDDYQYMHRLFSGNIGIEEDLIFTPITGQAGDTLRVSILCLANPDEYHSPDGIQIPLWGWTFAYGIQLRYQATPSNPPQVSVMERANSISIRQEEAPELTNSWSEEELESRIGFRLYVNDAFQGTLRSVDRSKPLRLRLMMWGSDVDSYVATFYVNHQPITVKPENLTTVRNQSGCRTIIETEVDISDLTGNVLVYAMVSSQDGMVTTSSDGGYTVTTRDFIFNCE